MKNYNERFELDLQLIDAKAKKRAGKHSSKIGAATLAVGAGIYVASILSDIYKPGNMPSLVGSLGSVFIGFGSVNLGLGLTKFFTGKKQIEKIQAQLKELDEREEPFEK